MPAEVDVCNDALSQIGASTIAGLDDGTVNANYCTIFYPTLRDGLLEQYQWTFTKQRVQLAQDATPPLFEYAFSYTLPADCLKVIEYAGSNQSVTIYPIALNLWEVPFPWTSRYKVESGHLFTNDGVVYIGYQARTTDPNRWSGLFYQALTSFLASKLASALTKDPKKSLELYQLGNVLLDRAIAVDGQQDSVEPFHTDDLLWGR